MAGYVRVDTSNNISDGNVIAAADLDNEFDGVQSAFNASTGHTHGGAVGEGAPITKLGPTNDVTISASLMAPKTTNTVDLGSSSLRYKDLFLAGNATIAGTLGVTGVATLGAGAILNTPASVTLTNATGLPISTGVSGLGTGVATALAVNVGSAGAPVLFNGALGTPSSGTVTNLTGTASININGTVGATTPNTGSFTTLTTSGAVTHNAGTANGVAYLNGSKVLTTGSALTFDGTNLGVGTTPTEKLDVYTNSTANTSIKVGNTSGSLQMLQSNGIAYLYTATNQPIAFSTNNTEQMRLTSTGLGIGTSSPGARLVAAAANTAIASRGTAYLFSTNAMGANLGGQLSLGGSFTGTTETVFASIAGRKENGTDNDIGGYLQFSTTNVSLGNVERMRLDASGNLGLGVTPSAWSAFPALQFAQGFSLSQGGLGVNTYFNSGFKYITTGAATLYQPGSGAHIWYNAPSGTAGNAISFTQAMTLNASGDLGLGTTSPTNSTGFSTFSVNGSTGGQIVFQTSGTYKHSIFSTSTDLNLYNSVAGNIIFATNNTERARIDSSGNLLVGTTSTAISSSVGIKLLNDSAKRLAIVSSESANAGGESLTMYSTGAGAFRFYVGWGGTVYATSTSISAISDATLKENVRDLETGLTEVMALRPRRFDWKNGDAQDVAGFVAQEVEQVLPELVTDYQYSEGVTKKSLKMGDILPTLVKAIQEQQAIITALTARVAALESN